MKLKVLYPDSSQRFNMGGPYIGPLELNGERLQFEFLDNNYVSDSEQKYFGFIRFNWRKEKKKILFGLLNWTSTFREFKILVHDSAKNKWMLSKKTWDAIYLTKLSDRYIFYVEAFHNDSPELFSEKRIKLNEYNFDLVTEKEIKTVTNNGSRYTTSPDTSAAQ